MFGFIKKEFLKTLKYIKENLLKLTLIFSIVFFVVTIIYFFLMKMLPEEELEVLFEEINAMFDTKDVINADGSISALGLFINNSQAMIYTVLLGIVPFLFLPVSSVLLNAVITGAVLGIIDATTDYNILYLILTKLLPHGVFELPALFISVAMGVRLCLVIIKKIIGKKDISLKYHFLNLIRVVLFILIPLLSLAAIIEASL